MKNFSDAEIGITRGDLRRIIEDWVNRNVGRYSLGDRRVEISRISPDAKYCVRVNVLSPTVVQMRTEDKKKSEAA